MIVRLRRRLTLMVIAVLALVTAGIIASIGLSSYRAVDRRAYAALDVLARERGMKDEGTGNRRQETGTGNREPGTGDGEQGMPPEPWRAEPPGFDGDMAGLFNHYTVDLDAAGAVAAWSSDRQALYTDSQVAALAAAALATGDGQGRIGSQYFRLVDLDGARRLIVVDARLERLAARGVLHATVVTSLLAAAALSAGAWLLIRRMVKPVQQAFERQKQFVWDASHEFKTPLAVISANAEVLAGDIGENEYLGYIQSEVKRTDRLVQSLLTLARMDKGTVTARMQRFDLSQALLGVALPFESTVFEAGRTLEIDVPEGVFVRGDAEMLQQLAVILLSNALKYSNDGGVIRLSLRQRGRGCQLSVYNTGAGIAPDNLERIFDRFYREDLSHNSAVAGNGLGLAIARNIVEAHKGRIHAESEYGKNATFVVAIP